MESLTQKNTIQITAKESGDRVDALLAAVLTEFSRSAVQRMLENGSVTLDGKTVRKNYRCRAGDVFEILLPPPEPAELKAQNIPLSVVYEDADLIVINKERGMVVHPAPGHPDGTLVNALLYHCGSSLSGIGGTLRPGIVHRIDKDTSGLLVAAKNDFAHIGLSEQLQDHSLFRVYDAVVRGHFSTAEGTVRGSIGRSTTDRKKMAVTEKNSKPAVTHWMLVAQYSRYAHIRCRLETGRTHQIRVHMASIGHPLLGDALYGAPCPDKGLSGQCLHASELQFKHPRTGEAMAFQAPLPEYFKQVLQRLGPKEPEE
jgi:23S rRNA pseudouridine1911/1915/1917 synthase